MDLPVLLGSARQLCRYRIPRTALSRMESVSVPLCVCVSMLVCCVVCPPSPVSVHAPVLVRCQQLVVVVVVVACIGLLNSPASKIVLSFLADPPRVTTRSGALHYHIISSSLADYSPSPEQKDRSYGMPGRGTDSTRYALLYSRKERPTVSPCAYVSPRLSPPVSCCLIFLRFKYGWLMVFRGPRVSRHLARGIRTRLRSRGLSFVDKRRGVNFVYNPVGENTGENIVPMLRGTRDNVDEEDPLLIWHFDVTLLSSYLSDGTRRYGRGIFSPLPEDIERVYNLLGL